MWFMWIIVLFALMGGWGGNWNNRGNMGAEIFANGSMTRDQIADQFSMQDIKEGIRGVQNGLCDGFYAQNSTMLNGFNGVQRDIMQTGYQLGSQLSENRFAQQQCCCETNRNIDAVRYENSQQTCEIANAIHAEGEATRALINANVMQDLRDRLQDEKLANSQCAQNAYLINQLQPVAKPAYITCSPYAANSGCCGGY